MTMTKKQRLIFHHPDITKESPNTKIPLFQKNLAEQRMLLRALMNVRAPKLQSMRILPKCKTNISTEVIEERVTTFTI